MGSDGWFNVRVDDEGHSYLEVTLRGLPLHATALLNKGTAFTDQERDEFGLRGLLPPRVCTMDEQLSRVWENYSRANTDLERYMDLAALMDRNETLFYRLLADHLEELMPIVYTPTVGQACKEFGHIFRRGRGLYITAADRNRIDDILANWPMPDVGAIVITDGQRILGLGDLGANGMGIPIGKLSLYVAAAGIDPAQTLPVCIDVGTDNEGLLNDPLYLGVRQRRLRGPEYDELIQSFMEAVERRYPDALVQFEDFGTENAFRLLHLHRDRFRCFNDDIQGTAAVVTAGVLAAMDRLGSRLADQRFVLAGAGESATGIASLLCCAMADQGISEADALSRFWFVDSQGLVYDGRGPLAPHKQRFAQSAQAAEKLRARGGTHLAAVVRNVSPTILIGASGQPGLFDRDVIESIAHGTPTPVVFALSNPTSKSECTPEQVYEWTKGQALVVTGSPFNPVFHDGAEHRIGQANNAFIFPGLGLGVLASGARHVPDRLFLAAARTLAELAPGDALYPPVSRMRDVAVSVAVAVAEEAIRLGVANDSRESAAQRVARRVWEPRYLPYRRA